MSFLIVDPWQSCVCFIRSGVTRCTLLMVLYLDRMCQCGLHALLWSHIGTLMHRLSAEPCSTAGLLFPFRCPSGTILLTAYSMVWDWRVSRAGPMLLYWPKLLYPYYGVLPIFPFLFFPSIGWYCGAGVFALIGCTLISLSLALPTFFNSVFTTMLAFCSVSIFIAAVPTDKCWGCDSWMVHNRAEAFCFKSIIILLLICREFFFFWTGFSVALTG